MSSKQSQKGWWTIPQNLPDFRRIGGTCFGVPPTDSHQFVSKSLVGIVAVHKTRTSDPSDACQHEEVLRVSLVSIAARRSCEARIVLDPCPGIPSWAWGVQIGDAG